MRNKKIVVPAPKLLIQPSPGFVKKELADFKLDLLGLCGFGCRYCSSNEGNYLRIRRAEFAEATEKQIGERVLPADDPSLTFEWQDVIARLEAELGGQPKDWGRGQVLVVSMLTDAFSPNLVTTGLTEKALRLVLERTGFRIRILTKNAIVGKDPWLKLFSEHRDRFVVGLSIGTTDNDWARKIEIGTSLPSARLRALERLQDAGVPTFGMLCPVFPDMLQDDLFERLVDAHHPELLEHLWCEPFNDRANWRVVRDGYEKGSTGYSWFTETYEKKRKDQWSACARDLYTRLQVKAQKEGWLDKLRYLLYEDKVTEEDAPSFAGLTGVLLQCKPTKEGTSSNKYIARLQEDMTADNDAQSDEEPNDQSLGQADRVARIVAWARSRSVSKEQVIEAAVAAAARSKHTLSSDQAQTQVDRAYSEDSAGTSSSQAHQPPSADELLEWAGVSPLTAQSPMADVENGLRLLAQLSQGLNGLTAETVRQGAMRALNRIKMPASKALVQKAFSGADTRTTENSLQDKTSGDNEVWPSEVEGAALLDEIVDVFQRYLALPPGAAEAFALWTLHTYTIDVASVSPFLALSSPEKRCGKTTALTLLDALVKDPLVASNITPAALFRSVEEWKPTLLIDEADTFIRKSDDLRGILNSGHTRSAAYVVRVVGDDHTPKRFSTWCAKAIALIGRLPATLEDRAIAIPMRRRAPGEKIERLRQDQIHDELEPLRRKAARWTRDHLDRLRDADPSMPSELHDRAQDNWRSLFAIAEEAGAPWPKRVVEVSRKLHLGEEDEAPRIQLLADIRSIFSSSEDERLSSDYIIADLVGRDDRPWAEWHRGQPMTKAQLARQLKHFDIRPKVIRIGTRTPRGYELSQFDDAFRRYLVDKPQQAQQVDDPGKNPDVGHRNSTPTVAPGKSTESAEESGLLRVLQAREWKDAS